MLCYVTLYYIILHYITFRYVVSAILYYYILFLFFFFCSKNAGDKITNENSQEQSRVNIVFNWESLSH